MYKFKIKRFITLTILVFSAIQMNTADFKSNQKKYKRVKNAYKEKELLIKNLFKEKKLDYTNFEIIITAFKLEKDLIVYIKDKNNSKFTFFKKYEFCMLSGNLGPKRKEGDNQVPEGLYQISNFNPQSNYHLSLKINYPNASDKVLSDKKKPGGDIYIHGNCVSIGCIPITDDLIEELYVLCVESKSKGYEIPVYIFPFKMTKTKFDYFNACDYTNETKNLWENLQKAYTLFNSKKCKLNYSINSSGKYIYKE